MDSNLLWLGIGAAALFAALYATRNTTARATVAELAAPLRSMDRRSAFADAIATVDRKAELGAIDEIEAELVSHRKAKRKAELLDALAPKAPSPPV